MVRRVKFRPPIAGGDNNGLYYCIVFDHCNTVKRFRGVWNADKIDITVFIMAVCADI